MSVTKGAPGCASCASILHDLALVEAELDDLHDKYGHLAEDWKAMVGQRDDAEALLHKVATEMETMLVKFDGEPMPTTAEEIRHAFRLALKFMAAQIRAAAKTPSVSVQGGYEIFTDPATGVELYRRVDPPKDET